MYQNSLFNKISLATDVYNRGNSYILYVLIHPLFVIMPTADLLSYLFFNTLLTTRTDDTSLLVEVNTSTFHT